MMTVDEMEPYKPQALLFQAEGSVNRIQTSEQLEEDLKQLSTDNSQLQ